MTIKRGEQMTFNKPVEKLVENGQFNYGHYNERIKVLNPLEADFFKSFTPELFKQSRLKEWQIFNLSSTSFTGLLLIMDLKYVQVIHVNLYDIAKKRFYKKTIIKPPMTFELLNSLDSGHFFYSDENLFLEIITGEDQVPLKINLSFVSEIDQMPIKLMLEGNNVVTEPFVYCKPIQSEKAIYSHRRLLPCNGSLMISSSIYPFESNQANVIAEDYKSFQPFEMDSTWVAASIPGTTIAFYFSVNPYSQESEVCENLVWIDGKAIPISNVTLTTGPLGWQFISADGSVQLTFVPKTLNRLSEGFMMIKASCDLPCGEISGKILLDGVVKTIEAVPAVGGRLALKL